jgi:hypothetical protein
MSDWIFLGGMTLFLKEKNCEKPKLKKKEIESCVKLQIEKEL